MKVLRTVASLNDAGLHRDPAVRIGFVPTMGALHEGHLSLFRAARRECDVVVASIFVNPTQFGDPADLAAYPRDEERDAAAASEAGVHYLFAPDAAGMYGPEHHTWVEVDGVASGFEADFRPGHFRGVATVCLKFFNIVRPHVAYFGQKDAQQVAVVTQMVRDLNVPLEIRVGATVRDADGVALSSRNARLSREERRQASVIPLALEAALAAFASGSDPVAAARLVLADLTLDYLSVAHLTGHPTLLVAVRVGRTRLIDNVRLDVERPGSIVQTLEASSGH